MTPEEYQQAKADIIAQHGQPVRDFDEKNESARLIDKLNYEMKAKKLLAARQAKRESLNDFVDNLPKSEVRKAVLSRGEAIDLEEHDLGSFSDLEKDVIRAYFDDDTLTHSQLARKFDVTRGTITKLFHSQAFEALEIKYFNFIATRKTRRAVLHLLQAEHEKTVHRMGEHFGIIKAERQDVNIISKPIEDPDALKMLKELGDKLAKPKED